MFALLCKPVVVPLQAGSPILRANECRISYVRPSESKEDTLEIEILEAPPIIVGGDDK